MRAAHASSLSRLLRDSASANVMDPRDQLKADLVKEITPQQARRRMNAADQRRQILQAGSAAELAAGIRDRVVLWDSGVFCTRRNHGATIKKVIAGGPGKPGYYVYNGTGCWERTRDALDPQRSFRCRRRDRSSTVRKPSRNCFRLGRKYACG
jgi:hypothetical protein